MEGFVELMATLLDTGKRPGALQRPTAQKATPLAHRPRFLFPPTERLLALAESYPKEAEHWNSFMTILVRA